MNRPGVAASPARVVDGIVTPPFRSLQRRREFGGHAVSLEVTEERVRGSEGSGFKDFQRGGAEAQRYPGQRVATSLPSSPSEMSFKSATALSFRAGSLRASAPPR